VTRTLVLAKKKTIPFHHNSGKPTEVGLPGLWYSRYSRHCTSVSVWFAAPRFRHHIATSSELVIPLSRLVTVGDRSFAVAGPWLWNTLPEDITSAPSLLVFLRKLMTHLFRQSYLDIILYVACVACCARWSL